MKNPLLEKYKQNESSLGTFMGLDSTAAALALGEAGLDFVVIYGVDTMVLIDHYRSIR